MINSDGKTTINHFDLTDFSSADEAETFSNHETMI